MRDGMLGVYVPHQHTQCNHSETENDEDDLNNERDLNDCSPPPKKKVLIDDTCCVKRINEHECSLSGLGVTSFFSPIFSVGGWQE